MEDYCMKTDSPINSAPYWWQHSHHYLYQRPHQWESSLVVGWQHSKHQRIHIFWVSKSKLTWLHWTWWTVNLLEFGTSKWAEPLPTVNLKLTKMNAFIVYMWFTLFMNQLIHKLCYNSVAQLATYCIALYIGGTVLWHKCIWQFLIWWSRAHMHCYEHALLMLGGFNNGDFDLQSPK